MNKLLCYRVSIIITLYLGYAFYSFTRKSISFMLPHFAANTHSNSSNSLNITKNDIGIIISSQNIAYALSKFFFGILSDLVSCRILFGSGLFLSGLLNIGMRKEIKIYNLYGLSFLIGLAQGPAWPTCAKILRNWLPKEQFGTWWAIVSTATNVAGALGPVGATFIALHYHWSIGFMILGCICMSVGYLAIIILRNQPSDVGFRNYKHNMVAKIRKKSSNDEGNTDSDESDEDNDDEKNKISRFQQTKLMLSYPFYASICLVYFIVVLVRTLYSDVSQMYLIKVIKVDPYTASQFVSSFELFGILGSIISGILSDFIFHCKNRNNTNKTNKTPNTTPETPIKVRFVLVCIYLASLIVCLHLFNFHMKAGTSKIYLLSISSASGFLCYGTISLLGVMAMEFTSFEFSGTSHAIAALSANIGAIFAGLPFSLVSKLYTWNFAFKLVQYFAVFVLMFSFIFRNSKKYCVPITIARKTQ